jgi:hypothetical protein
VIEDAEYRVDLFAIIAMAQARIGDRPGATSSLAAAFDALESVEGLGRIKDSLLKSIAMAQGEMGDIEAAVQTIDKMSDARSRATALIEIARRTPLP